LYFAHRREAGCRLAAEVKGLGLSNPVVLGIPRGGVEVAAPVALALQAPLGIVIPRKIGVPHNPEVAAGALTPDGQVLWDHALLHRLGLSPSQLETEVDRERAEIERRITRYAKGAILPTPAGRPVILVDDGLATGFTVQAALQYLRRSGARELVLAVPVGSPEAAARLSREVDRLVCLHTPEPFYAVGQFYEEFGDTPDDLVQSLLREVNHAIAGNPS